MTPVSISTEPTLEELALPAGRRVHPGFRRWLRWAIVIVLAWVLVQVLGSLLVQHTRFRNVLNARLEAAFGRRIEVAHYSLRFWGWPELEASPVVVFDDPRFGNEYFLRADSLIVRIRWTSLLAGHLELGVLSLSHPSLNLVRAANGQWNIEEWLPAPSGLPGGANSGSAGNTARVRIRRIELESGRVNFKRGAEKLPFAFVGVTGTVEQQAPGRWQVSLDASPARAALALQQAGTLHVEGQLGGTSSCLRPADLTMSWQNAAVADALRLFDGYDHGARGQLSLSLEAHTLGPIWTLGGRAELRRLHRWDLPLRNDNPAVNVQMRANWLPEASEIDFSDAALETPRSSVHGAGVVSWDPSRQARFASEKTALVLSSNGIDMEDVIAWVRAFHPNVSEALNLRGSIDGRLTVAGWPLRPVGGSLRSASVTLEGGSLRAPLLAGPAAIEFDSTSAKLLPLRIGLGDADSALQLIGFADETGPLALSARLTGRAARAEDLIDAVSALGWKLPGEWSISGPASLDLLWSLPGWNQPAQTFGEIGLENVEVRAPFLNHPVSRLQGRVELTGNAEELAVTSAEAFGGQWSGSVAFSSPEDGARFSLRADRLNAEDLDGWLNPRWRQGFLSNVLPFLPGSGTEKIPLTFRTSGRLEVDSFAFSRYTLRQLAGNFTLEQRQISFQDAEADFSGGKIAGSLQADLRAAPAYDVNARFSGLNLATLVAGAPSLARQISGTSSGEIEIRLQGAGASMLAASLDCRGRASIQPATLQGFDLLESARAGARRGASSAFSEVAGNFSCRNDQVELSGVRLRSGDAALSASGSVDFGRNADLRLRWLPRARATGREESAANPAAVLLRGPLFAPRIEPAGTTPSE